MDVMVVLDQKIHVVQMVHIVVIVEEEEMVLPLKFFIK